MDELEYILIRASRQTVDTHRIDMMIKGGDFKAFIRDRLVDFSPVSNVSTSMVILYSLPLDSKAYVEDLLENARGLYLSSLPARKRRDLFS